MEQIGADHLLACGYMFVGAGGGTFGFLLVWGGGRLFVLFSNFLAMVVGIIKTKHSSASSDIKQIRVSIKLKKQLIFH